MKFIFFIFLFFGLSARATNYFVALSGNDGNTGTSTGLAWRSISRVDAGTYNPGDSIFFNRGDIFTGQSLNINGSGSAGNPIVVSVYGTGNLPILSGQLILNFVSMGGGKYEAVCPGCSLVDNLVTINGVNTPMGRWPNYTWENFQSSTGVRLIDPNLSGQPSYNGATVIFKSAQYILDPRVATQSGDTLNFSALSATGLGATSYFIQNSPNVLDVFGEWYLNTSTDSLQMFFGSVSPSSVVVATTIRDTLIDVNFKSYITFMNLDLEYSNLYSVLANHGSNIIFQACKFKYGGNNSFSINETPSLTIINCFVKNFNNDGLFLTGSTSTNAFLQWDTLSCIGALLGMGQGGDHNYEAINITLDGGKILNCRIDTVGFNPIFIAGDSFQVKHNYINYFCFNKDDGGGVYTWNSTATTYHQRYIDSNVIINGIGAQNGFPLDPGSAGSGIYIDNVASNISARGNTIMNCGNGLFDHGPTNILDSNNIHNCTFANIFISEVGSTVITGIIVKANVSSGTNSTQQVLRLSSTGNDLGTWTIDNNKYLAPKGDSLMFFTKSSVDGGTLRTLTGIQSTLSLDIHSTFATGVIIIPYNPNASNQNYGLPGTYVDAFGNSYSVIVILTPYSSVILLVQNLGYVQFPYGSKLTN